MQAYNFDLAKILSNFKIDSLNTIQIASLKANKEHQDVVLLANTGSGKTIAFLLPILELLSVENKKTQAIIVVPTRELALQIETVFKTMQTGFKVSCCYGGHLRSTEENNLIIPPALLIGTPGRIGDHIRRENITLETITTLVLDEFDKSLELGFLDEIEFIIQSLPTLNKRILTSATQTENIPTFIGLKNACFLNFLHQDYKDATQLAVHTLYSPTRDKLDTLFKLICYLGDRSSIIFCNHRDAVERTSEALTTMGIFNVFYHGKMEQKQRDYALCKFRNGTSNILVTTDLAARGLDIPNIRYIIHYHLPNTEETFTHRNGRTARMDASGTVILILSDDEKLPKYIEQVDEKILLPETTVMPDKPKWTTLYIAAGKKDKINKIDIVGFLSHKAELKSEDIGLIEVKDFFSFVAIRKTKVYQTIELIRGHKMKHKSINIEVAK